MSSVRVQFVGLVLFINDKSPMNALLGDFAGHDRFIALPKGNVKTVAGGWKSLGTFSNHKREWSAWTLDAGRTVCNGTGAAPAYPSPGWLSHLKSDCCPEFVLNETNADAATVRIEHGSLTCARDRDRIDTIWKFMTDGDLEIAHGKDRITCSVDTDVVIGNAPLEYFKDDLAPPTPRHKDAMSHYMHYYELGKDAGCAEVPAQGRTHPCTQHTTCRNPEKDPPMTAVKEVSVRGVQIDCSNSTYP